MLFRSVVRTDAAGRYTLEGEGDGFLFVVKPRNWTVPLDAQNLPRFYRKIGDLADPGRVVDPALPSFDFPLVAGNEPDRFRTIVFADTQVGSEKEVGYFQRTIIDGLVSEVAPTRRGGREVANPGRVVDPALPLGNIALGITLGDVVNDKPELYDALNAAIARIGVPWYPLIGNHDLDLGALQDRGSAATFEAKYGPSTHAFQYGPVLFVALNNIRYQGGLRYLGGLTDGQFGFIQQLLAGTPRETLARFNAEVLKAFAQREVYDQVDKTGLQPAPQSLEEAAQFTRHEAEKWGRAVKVSGASAD